MKERGSQLSLASVTISYFIHATEDIQRLNDEVCASFGLKLSELSLEELEGHYGNRVQFVKVHTINRRASEVFEQIGLKLTEASRREISQELEKSMDEHDALYLRIDRQTLFRGLSLSDEEPIRVKLKPKFRLKGPGEMASLYRREMKI